MADELTTRPMFEALLDGQRQMAEKLDALAAKQDAVAEKLDELAGRQDRLEVHVTELISRIEDGFDDTNRKIEIFNDRLLSFETWLKKVTGVSTTKSSFALAETNHRHRPPI